MKINKGDEEWYIVPGISKILCYKNDAMDCIYTDYGEDYLVIPAELEEYPLLALMAKAEGCEVVDYETYDPTEEPHIYVISGLCRYFRSEINETFGVKDE